MDQVIDYVIIGGGIAGMTAAEAIRERNKDASIAVFSMEPHLLYSRVLLPSYIKQRIPREKVFMRTIQQVDLLNIGVHANEEVMSVMPERHEIVLKSGRSLGYKKLLIASGGRVRQLALAGLKDLSGVYRLQTIDDADLLHDALPSIRNAVVIGGGFIALEFLEILTLRKIPTTLIFPEARFFERFVGPAGSALYQENFERHGIKVIAGDEARAVEGAQGRVTKVITKNGNEILCDALCAGVGIQRNIEFLEGSGIQRGAQGILVNEYLETSAPDVYAAGDIAEFNDVVLGMTHMAGNWNSAFLQGKIAGRGMAGDRAAFINLSNYSLGNLGLHLSLLGDVGPHLASIIRQSAKPVSYAEFFVKDGLVRGAVMINGARHQATVQKWIIDKVSVAGKEAILQDPEADLAQIG